MSKVNRGLGLLLAGLVLLISGTAGEALAQEPILAFGSVSFKECPDDQVAQDEAVTRALRSALIQALLTRMGQQRLTSALPLLVQPLLASPHPHILGFQIASRAETKERLFLLVMAQVNQASLTGVLKNLNLGQALKVRVLPLLSVRVGPASEPFAWWRSGSGARPISLALANLLNRLEEMGCQVLDTSQPPPPGPGLSRPAPPAAGVPAQTGQPAPPPAGSGAKAGEGGQVPAGSGAGPAAPGTAPAGTGSGAPGLASTQPGADQEPVQIPDADQLIIEDLTAGQALELGRRFQADLVLAGRIEEEEGPEGRTATATALILEVATGRVVATAAQLGWTEGREALPPDQQSTTLQAPDQGQTQAGQDRAPGERLVPERARGEEASLVGRRMAAELVDQLQRAGWSVFSEPKKVTITVSGVKRFAELHSFMGVMERMPQYIQEVKQKAIRAGRATFEATITTTTHHLADLLLAEDYPDFFVSVVKADEEGLELKLVPK